jgi:hypothetical protein
MCPNHCEKPPFSHLELEEHRMECPLEVVKCNICNEQELPRKDLQRHIANDCPKGQQECKKCHGIYKATEEHCCISQLYKLIMATRDMATQDRA